jgi:hypothetical protein
MAFSRGILALLVALPSVRGAVLSASASYWAKLMLVLKQSSPVPSMDLQSDPGALLFDARIEFRNFFRRCNESKSLQKFVPPDCWDSP